MFQETLAKRSFDTFAQKHGEFRCCQASTLTPKCAYSSGKPDSLPAPSYFSVYAWRRRISDTQGRSYRGSGGFGRTSTGRKRSAKIVFFFFFLSGIAEESVFVEKDERTPPTENKSCKTRHGQVQKALRPNAVAAKETSRRPTCKTRRGQVRMRPAAQTAKERLRCHLVQLNVVETTMGRKEQRERERKKAAKGSHALRGFGFLPKSNRGPTET